MPTSMDWPAISVGIGAGAKVAQQSCACAAPITLVKAARSHAINRGLRIAIDPPRSRLGATRYLTQSNARRIMRRRRPKGRAHALLAHAHTAADRRARLASRRIRSA